CSADLRCSQLMLARAVSRAMPAAPRSDSPYRKPPPPGYRRRTTPYPIMKITPERTVGSIVAEDYRAAAVLTKYGIDFCCKGGRSVQEVCEKQHINPDKLAEDITALLARDAKDADDVRSWPVDQLADHVETVHHRYVEERGPIIQQYLAKLCKVHGDRHPELFTINEEFNACIGAMAMHMKKEELVLFPFVRNLAKSERTGEPFRP